MEAPARRDRGPRVRSPRGGSLSRGDESAANRRLAHPIGWWEPPVRTHSSRHPSRPRHPRHRGRCNKRLARHQASCCERAFAASEALLPGRGPIGIRHPRRCDIRRTFPVRGAGEPMAGARQHSPHVAVPGSRAWPAGRATTIHQQHIRRFRPSIRDIFPLSGKLADCYNSASWQGAFRLPAATRSGWQGCAIRWPRAGAWRCAR
jgi:hypothetical protein